MQLLSPGSAISAAGEADKSVEQARAARVAEAFAREGRASQRRALVGRIVALLGVAAWLLYVYSRTGNLPRSTYYLLLLGAFLVSGFVQLWLGRERPRPWMPFVFVTIDVALLTFTLTVPPLWGPPQESAVEVLGGAAFVFYFLVLVATMLSTSPWLVLWTGGAIAAGWSAAILWLVPPHAMASTIDARVLWAEVIVSGVVSGLIAFAVHRARAVAKTQVVAEHERANLARYFSPNMVDRLAASEEPLKAAKVQDVAVLFADIVGFTTLSASIPPQAVVDLLREHFARLEQVVFRHGGTLDKYMGDGLMATFGTPQTGTNDATRALACGRDMLVTLAEWNRVRTAAGEAPVRIGIGIHYGPVVMGNIGGERRLEFTVIGDTVNIASRIETMTRELGSDLLVSSAVVGAIRSEGAGEAALIGLADLGPQTLRGRDGAFGVWGLRPGA
jgi:adenylate cyclase